MIRWRVVLCAEDGQRILANGFVTKEEAENCLKKRQWLYGDSSKIIVESYKDHHLPND